MYSVILCGGSGIRLWPLSRKNYPKHFLKLFGEHSLLQETFLRMKEIMPIEHIYLITNRDNFFNVYNQIKEIAPDFAKEQIMTEPVSLNTAPAMAYAIKYMGGKMNVPPTEPIIFLPSDHHIGKRKEYLELVKKAMSQVGDHIGTIGITPNSPSSFYGYIKKGIKMHDYTIVEQFKEKPDMETAKSYIASGQYVWNAGMFIFNIQTFLNETKQHVPEMYTLMTQDFKTFERDFKTLPSISIDHAVGEKSNNMIVFEADIDWSDISSFDALAGVRGKIKDGHAWHVGIDSSNIFVHSDSNRMVATVGVDDLVVVESADTILIHKRGRGDDVQQVVDILKARKEKELEHNLIVHRPWGKIEMLLKSPTLKARRLTVYPGETINLDGHYHRVKHWIVVKGIAKITKDEQEMFLRENESTFIPALSIHQLGNPGRINLDMIEVQTGSYLEEDDIIRQPGASESGSLDRDGKHHQEGMGF